MRWCVSLGDDKIIYIYIYLESYVYSSSVLYILQINFSFFAFYYKNICPPIIVL